ncbi:hypothetical protein VTG60DRAFT_7197 [Thermothelomyces hinnuleus]
MSASLYAAVGAMSRPALARRSLMSAMDMRSRGVTAGTDSASGSLAAGAKASERSGDFECKAADGGTNSGRGTWLRRPLAPGRSGAELSDGRPRKAPIRIALRILAGAGTALRSGGGNFWAIGRKFRRGTDPRTGMEEGRVGDEVVSGIQMGMAMASAGR